MHKRIRSIEFAKKYSRCRKARCFRARGRRACIRANFLEEAIDLEMRVELVLGANGVECCGRRSYNQAEEFRLGSEAIREETKKEGQDSLN